jgi:AcrR family transcriptional regulator
MPSTYGDHEPRRKPQQARASARRTRFLEVAAQLIAEMGYEAVTMTAIAGHAKASIGTLYDYFPDKHAVAVSLLAQYTEELDAHWNATLAARRLRPKTDLGSLLVDEILTFVRERPVYLALLDAPIVYSRSSAARQPVRRTFAVALETMNPKIDPKRALLSAQLLIEAIKGFLAVYQRTAAGEKAIVAEEFKKLVGFYLRDVLR